MVDSKVGKVRGGYSLSEPSLEREIADLSSRPDFLTKLVKLLTLAECRNDKTFDDTRRSPDLVVVKTDTHGFSPVSLTLVNASKSTDTLRSSSESDAPAPALALDAGTHDPFERIMPVRVSKSSSALKGRNKRERRSVRRKGRPSKPPLSEPATTLTTIPEISSVFERNSVANRLSFMKSTEQLLTEDALMDTDSSRARAAIALARAQLEHSRPASIHRKRERASNKLMMLPGEYEEYRAMQASLTPAQKTPTSEFGEVRSVGDEETMRRTVQQSQSMVLTLMAAKEAVSMRAEARKSSHAQVASISTIDLLKECQASFPEVYRRGDAPLCPPPSIPLPQLPPPPTITLPPSLVSPKQIRPQRSRASLRSALPTEYDGKALQRVDTLIQDLIVSRSESTGPRQRSCSTASSSSRLEKVADTLPTRQDDFNKPQQALALPEPAVVRKPTYPAQFAIRLPSNGALLTPAPTPPTSSPIPSSKSALYRYEDLAETERGACRGAKYGAQSGTPKAPKLAVPSGQHFQPYTSPTRPTRPQSLVGPDPPRRLAEAEAQYPSSHGAHRVNKPLTRPPGIGISTSSLQSLSVHTLTPQASPQKPVYATYRYI